MIATIEKDLDAVRPYQFDWTAWLDGDKISQAEFEVSPSVVDGVRIDDQSHDDTTCAAWLIGGVAAVSQAPRPPLPPCPGRSPAGALPIQP